jgi:hypothetical protein
MGDGNVRSKLCELECKAQDTFLMIHADVHTIAVFSYTTVFSYTIAFS